MTASTDPRVDALMDCLRQAYGGQRFVIAVDILAATTRTVGWLRRLGAQGALCIGASRGTGPGPDPDFAPDPIVLGVTGADMMSSVRRAKEALGNLPPDVVARVDAFDPEGTARVIGTIFDDGQPVAGRAKYGARPAAWQALEDKTTIDALWDELGVPRAASRIVRLDSWQELWAAVYELDRGDGTVWAADSKEGFHGGASFTRWVRDETDGRAVQAAFAPHADRVRVMPFLEGIPCSIHGWVFPELVAAFRPCEMLVFRKPDGTFHYGRAATFWDPPVSDREAMRRLARRVGEHLRAAVGYRGAFTLDGVMTADGFIPTELNPRFGAALDTLGSSVDLDLVLLNFAVVEGEPCDWRGEDLEALLVEAGDARRSARTMAVVSARIEEERRADLVWGDGEFRRAGPGEPADAVAVVGPHAVGGVAFVTFDPARTPVGPSCAPRAAAALRWCDEAWELGIGPLQAPHEVRGRQPAAEK